MRFSLIITRMRLCSVLVKTHLRITEISYKLRINLFVSRAHVVELACVPVQPILYRTDRDGHDLEDQDHTQSVSLKHIGW